jgi:hypothetical protein
LIAQRYVIAQLQLPEWLFGQPVLRRVRQRSLQHLLQPVLLRLERLKVFSLGLLRIRCELLALIPSVA